MRSNNNRSSEITKQIIEVIKINSGKKVKWKYRLNNKYLIFFTYYLKLLFTLNHTIKLFYQAYLLISIKLLIHFKLLSSFTKYPLNLKLKLKTCNFTIYNNLNIYH